MPRGAEGKQSLRRELGCPGSPSPGKMGFPPLPALPHSWGIPRGNWDGGNHRHSKLGLLRPPRVGRTWNPPGGNSCSARLLFLGNVGLEMLHITLLPCPPLAPLFQENSPKRRFPSPEQKMGTLAQEGGRECSGNAGSDELHV